MNSPEKLIAMEPKVMVRPPTILKPSPTLSTKPTMIRVTGVGKIQICFGQRANPHRSDHSEKHQFHTAPGQGWGWFEVLRRIFQKT